MASVATATSAGRGGDRGSVGAGFTLVEIMLVVLILAVLGAMVTPRMVSARHDAEVASLQATLQSMRVAVTQDYARSKQFPETIHTEVFVGHEEPRHPWDPTAATFVENDDEATADERDPLDMFVGGGKPPFWYNPANGQVKARIRDQGDVEANRDLWFRVNGEPYHD